MAVIKRYPNRKLYNTSTRQYITLDELADLIRGGEEIHVTDYASGEDLTALTLTQILFEQVKRQTGYLPRSLLTSLIQAGGHRLSALQRVLGHTLGLQTNPDEEIRRRIEDLVKQGELDPEEAERIQTLLTKDPSPVVEPAPAPESVQRILAEREVASRAEMQKLMEEVEHLTKALENLTPPPAQSRAEDQG